MYCVVAVDGQGLLSDPGGFIDAEVVKGSADAPIISGATYNAAQNAAMFSISPPASGAAAYIIERQTGTGTTIQWLHLATLPAPASGAASFADHRVRPGGHTYVYRVSVVDSQGNSSVHNDPTSGALVGYATATVTAN